MANLLPPQAESRVLRGFRARAIAGGSLVALAAAAASLFALFPAYITLHSARVAVISQSPIATTTDVSDVAADRAELARVRTVLSGLSMFKAGGAPIDALQVALSYRPSTVAVEKITYTPGAKGTLILSCQTAKREAMTTFRDALRAEKMFATVSVPIEELAGSTDGHFTITLTGDF